MSATQVGSKGAETMAVVYVGTSSVKPDRYEDFLELNRKTKAIVEKAGGKNVRLLAALVAGEATGSFALTIEADDFSAIGSLTDKVLAEPEFQEVVSAALGTSASPINGATQGSYWVDVPL
jgi:hypothetical protein